MIVSPFRISHGEMMVLTRCFQLSRGNDDLFAIMVVSYLDFISGEIKGYHAQRMRVHNSAMNKIPRGGV